MSGDFLADLGTNIILIKTSMKFVILIEKFPKICKKQCNLGCALKSLFRGERTKWSNSYGFGRFKPQAHTDYRLNLQILTEFLLEKSENFRRHSKANT